MMSRSIILLSSFQPTAHRDGLFVSVYSSSTFLGGCRSSRHSRRRPWVEVSGVPTTISAEGNDSFTSSSGASTTKRRSWEESFDLLRNYGDVHGHLNVPQLDSPLGPWVNRQRIEHARYLHNKKILQNVREEGTDNGKLRRTSMTDQRKAMLDEIGFVWDALGQSWNAHYEELREFRKVNGHCVVPRSNGRLGAWVEKQRVEYKRYLRAATSEGEGGAVEWSSLNVIKITFSFNNDDDESDEDEAPVKTILTEDRVNLLDAVDFVWDVRESQFERRIGELRVHRQAIGRMDPQSMNTSLAAWVRKYERQYQKFLDTADRGGVDDVTLAEILPENRRVALESVGFCRGMFVESSSTVNEIKKRRVNWEERYEELEEFKAKNGHCIVPKNYGPLGSWVRAQRHSMKEMQMLSSNVSGEMPIDVTQSINPFLSSERVDRLDRLGFVWDVHQWQWNQTYHELLRYKEEHGNTNTPISFGKLTRCILDLFLCIYPKIANGKIMMTAASSYDFDCYSCAR